MHEESKPAFSFNFGAAAPTPTTTTATALQFNPVVTVPKSVSLPTTSTSTARKEHRALFTVSGMEASSTVRPKLESPWRDVEWTAEQRTNLMKTVSSYRPSSGEVTQAQVLLLGPVGAGKSSFISSVQSVFSGRVTNRAMVGSSSSSSFTKKPFNILGQKGEDPTGVVLCDIMGLSDGEMTGLTLHDVLSVIKGHVPVGHKFSPDQPVTAETEGYVRRPTLQDKIHCVAFVVDASKVLTYPKGLSSTFQQLREHISDLGVHQVALLTQVDKICSETAKDVTHVYKSRIVQDMMSKAGALLGMSTSYIVPVRNYSSELNLDVNTDVLLLSAVDHILQYADLYFQDNTAQDMESVKFKN
ncbi:interferon-induced protein 44 isoform X2 [Stegastes partitus]|uniref:Interferon-induced protein 44 isoform X2 n=1 Tax=Stegastes partitus TaxID=144197 RepID=A0A9Y4KDD3_9TELE|nr:PREDICTED: interferon-induced protein 44-like isoform X2 [Stegastes partitus]